MPTFKLKDADGAEHTYETTLHRTENGAPLTAWVTGNVIEALTLALGDVGIEATQKAAAKGLTGWDAFKAIASDPEVLKKVDVGKVGKALSDVVIKLSVPRQLAVLKNTNRDGKPLVEDGKPTHMYSTAYPANYPELGQAVFQVCKVNGFFPALGALGDALKAALAATPSTPESEE